MIKLELEEGTLEILSSNIITRVRRQGMILHIEVRRKGITSPFNKIVVPIPESNNDKIINELEIPFEDLDLSVRAFNCLKAAKINSLSELIQYEQEDLMKFRNFGQKSISELEQMLHERGLHFGMNLAEL